MNDVGAEIIFNLWYVRDEEGFIYSLRARAYVTAGTETDKTTFLKTHADVDYLIARPFPVPQRYQTQLMSIDGAARLPVAHVAFLDLTKSRIDLWEEAIRTLEAELPSQTKLPVPKSLVVCMTPLLADDAGQIRPYYIGVERY